VSVIEAWSTGESNQLLPLKHLSEETLHPSDRSIETPNTSSFFGMNQGWDPDKSKGSHLTSRGVCARFNIFTTAWTPLQSSNTLSEREESTRIQSSVSSTALGRGDGSLSLGVRAPSDAAGCFETWDGDAK
jgi:hypothetical protein